MRAGTISVTNDLFWPLKRLQPQHIQRVSTYYIFILHTNILKKKKKIEREWCVNHLQSRCLDIPPEKLTCELN